MASSSSDVVDELAVAAGGEQRRLVEHVGQVGTGEAGGALGDGEQVDVAGERLALGVHLEDVHAALQVGAVDGDLPVEAAGAQQRRVEDVGPVGGGDEDHAALDVEAVHLDQQLVEGLLALVVAAAEARTAVPADGVDLVDEDDGRRVGLGLLEQVTDPGGADTDEHLDEVRAGDRVEGHAGLAGDGAREQRLAGAGRAVEQHALGDLGADRLELRRLLEELLDLLELLDGLVDPGDVGERGLRRVLGDELGLATCRSCITREPPPCIWFIRKKNSSTMMHDGQQADEQAHEHALLRDAGRCSRLGGFCVRSTASRWAIVVAVVAA